MNEHEQKPLSRTPDMESLKKLQYTFCTKREVAAYLGVSMYKLRQVCSELGMKGYKNLHPRQVRKLIREFTDD